MKPALIIGSTCVDIIINIPHLPVTQEDVHPTSQTMAVGGCSYNVAYTVRLLDVPHTHISPVGTGLFGDYVAKCLKESGAPINVYVPDRDNGCCYCFVEETGERTFMSHHGAEYTFQKEWMKDYDSSNYGLCYICGLEIEEPTGVNLLEYLEENQNLEFFFAPGPRVMHIAEEKLNRMLALQPIVHLNELEAAAITGIHDIKEAGRHLHAMTKNHVIITLGVQGTFYIEKDGTEGFIPSVPAEHVVDTIGAGDSHAGAVIACLTNDMTLPDSIAYANKLAAATVCVKGMSLTKDQLPNK